MLIAHLPAGYLLTSAIEARAGRSHLVMGVGLAASVLPDFDLLWFYLVNGRQTHHHEFLFHRPLFWVLVAASAWTILRLARVPRAGLLAGVALASLLLHMALDSVTAGIAWGWPFSERELNLVVVPVAFSWWVWSFVLHWSFLLELGIVAAAAAWWGSRRMRGVRASL